MTAGLAVALGLVGIVGLQSCNSPFRIRHHFEISKTGFRLDDKPMDSAAARDSLKSFCAEKNQRHIWKLSTSDTSLKARDFVQFLSFVASVNQDCRGLFALNETKPPLLMQPPVPAPRSIYNLSINRNDSLRPRASLMVVAERFRIRLYTMEGWLPEIPVAMDAKGMDWVASDKPGQIQIGWRDANGRCAVDVRGDHCTDSLWPKSKYVMLGNIGMLPDTIHTDNPKDMDWIVRGPLARDIAVAAEIHAIRTIPGTLADDRVYNHGVFDPEMGWASTLRLITSLRAAGIDFNTVELLQ